MLNIIGTIFLLIGIGGIVFLIVRKKDLVFQENFTPLRKKERGNKGKDNLQKVGKILPSLSKTATNITKKFLMKIKIFFIKCENGIDKWLQRVSQSKKFEEGYWERIKRKK